MREKKQGSGSVSDTEEAAYYLHASGLTHITITDALGNTNAPIAESSLRRLPGVTYEESSSGVEAILPTTRTYTLKFQGTGLPLALEVVKGVGNSAPTEAVRYLDLNLATGVWAQMRVSERGVEELRYDKDGDGMYESVVRPTAAVVGLAALDVHPPSITFKDRTRGARKLISIVTRDKGVGVKAVHYSFDGKHFQPYREPFLVDPARTKIVYAFADDKAANRSATATYQVPGLR